MRNNLFQFATSELSQDAFICWCLNWFNDDRKPRLREMAISLIKRMAGDIDVQSVEIIRQYSAKAEYKNDKNKKSFWVKIDVLAIINHSIGLIIEDKIYTGEHDNQINRYVEGIKRILELSEDGKLNYNKKSYEIDPDKLRTIFWKTGFHYDYDKVVLADEKLDGPEVLRLLSPYRDRGLSEILDDYLDNLDASLGWYKEYGNYTNQEYLKNYQCPQYRLMRTIFPFEMWKPVTGSGDLINQVDHGTSYGRPWTEMNVFQAFYPGTSDKWRLFWRIDSDTEGPYISLRFYEGDLKKDSEDFLARHVQKYEELKEQMKQVLSDTSLQTLLSWDDVNPGYRGNYKEASFFRVKLKDYLPRWKENGPQLIKSIQTINDSFLQKVSSN